MSNPTAWGLFLIRIAIGALFVWAGVNHLLNPQLWETSVPTMLSELATLGNQTWVVLAGCFEIALGTLLMFGVFVRPTTLLLALYITSPFFFETAHMHIVYLWSIAATLLGLSLTGGGAFSAHVLSHGGSR